MNKEPYISIIYDGKPEGFYKKDNLEEFLKEQENNGKIKKLNPSYYFFREEETTLGAFFEQEKTTIKAYGFEKANMGKVEEIIRKWEEQFNKRD